MIDTNIIISAALFPNGRAAQALYKALVPPYEPLLCDYVVDELHQKFREKFPDRQMELETFLLKALIFLSERYLLQKMNTKLKKQFGIQKTDRF